MLINKNLLVTIITLNVCTNFITCSDKYINTSFPSLQDICRKQVKKDFYQKVDRAFELVVKKKNSVEEEQELLEIFVYNKHLQEDPYVKANIKLPSIVNCATRDNGDTLLSLASLQNKEKVIQFLLENGSNSNQANNSRRAPLHYAAFYNAYEAVPLLLAASANVNAQDKYGETPLHYAVKNNAYKTVPLLLAADANVSVQNKYGNIPLDYAKSRKIKNLLCPHNKCIIS